MADVLEVRNLVKHFTDQKAVDGISFNVSQGEIFGLLGPNGAGKTTLIRMITGIFYPDAGQVILEGKPFRPEDAIKIGYMPEERGLYKRMKIGEQALYLAQLRGMKKQDAMESIRKWFTRFEMESWWNKKLTDLSKGMSQKLQFVTTVMHNPKLIILDEPFSGLDPVNTNLIKDEIYNLATNGATIIFSTHRMEQVEEICNRIVLINQGKKIWDGSVAGTKQHFKENKFRIHTSENGQAPVVSSPLFDVEKSSNNEWTLRKRDGVTNNQLLNYFIQNNIQVDGFEEILPSLNQIFIQLVQGTPEARAFSNNP